MNLTTGVNPEPAGPVADVRRTPLGKLAQAVAAVDEPGGPSSAAARRRASAAMFQSSI